MTRRIIDVHSHVGRTVSSGVGQSVPDWIALMAENGISQSVLSVAAGGLQAEGIVDTRRANDTVAEAIRTRPELFPLGLASVEVRHGAAGIAEVARAFDELGLRGLAFHATFEGFSVESDAFNAVLAATGDRRGLILLHSTPGAAASPGAIGTVAERYPNLVFVMGHPVFTAGQRAEAIAVVSSHPNVHLDVAYQSDPSTTTLFVQELGAERVYFGSDAPFFTPTDVIRSIEAADIAEADRERIFFANANELITSFQ